MQEKRVTVVSSTRGREMSLISRGSSKDKDIVRLLGRERYRGI